jgi:hypothetical protein
MAWVENWCGVEFHVFGLCDLRRLRVPGLVGLARRGCHGVDLLFLAEGEDVSRLFVPGSRLWGEVMKRGANEAHVCLHARERLDRLALKQRLVRRLEPPLNPKTAIGVGKKSAKSDKDQFAGRAARL